jgi:hypothetical protein
MILCFYVLMPKKFAKSSLSSNGLSITLSASLSRLDLYTGIDADNNIKFE